MINTSLTETLTAFSAQIAGDMPANMQNQLQSAIDRLVASVVAKRTLGVDAHFPDFN